MSDEASPTVAAGSRPAGTARPASAKTYGPWRREVRAFVELLGLATISVTQPALDVLSKNSSIFVANGASAFQVVVLALIVMLVPALALYLLELLLALLGPLVRRFVHAGLCGLLIGVFALQVAKKATDLAPNPLVAIAIGVGVVGGFLIWQFDVMRTFVRYLAIASVIFVVLFVGFSPVTDVVFGSSDATAAGVKVTTPHRVVFVLLDEFPLESVLDGKGNIDAELFPNFAALAKDSNWYRNFSSNSPYTAVAVPTMLSGQYPSDRAAQPVAADHPQNLFTLLGGAYDLNVHETATALCPKKLCSTTVRTSRGGIPELTSETVKLWKEFASPTRTRFSFKEDQATRYALRDMRAFTASLQGRSNRRLDFIHVELPHQPWHYFPDLKDYKATGTAPGSKILNWVDEYSAESGRQRHLLQAQAVDRLIGDVVAQLKRIGAYDSSMLVVTPDHGVAFSPGEGVRTITGDNWPQIMWTPTFVKLPGQRQGKVDDRPAQTVDVLPTVADVLGVKVPWQLDGRSLLGEPRTDGPRPVYQWGEHAIEPPNATPAPPGSDHLTFDGPTGFAEVLRSAAAFPGPDPALRLYRIGPYGDLVGREAKPHVRDVPGGPTLFNVENLRDFAGVNLSAPAQPWGFAHGYLNGVTQPTYVALVVNGRVAGVALAKPLSGTTSSYWYSTVLPQTMRDGRNDVRMYAVSGPATAPVLDPIPINRL